MSQADVIRDQETGLFAPVQRCPPSSSVTVRFRLYVSQKNSHRIVWWTPPCSLTLRLPPFWLFLALLPPVLDHETKQNKTRSLVDPFLLFGASLCDNVHGSGAIDRLEAFD